MNRFSTLPLKRLLRTVSPGAVSIKGNLDELADDEGFPAYSASGQDVRLLKPQFSGKGLILSSVGAQCGKCFYASGQWGIVANTQAFFPTKLADARYLFYLVNQQDFWEISGTAQPYVQVPMSMAKAVPAPPLAIQRKIAQFLDERTAQIDGLLKKKQRLLDLLTEKRQAIITQAVTKGIDLDGSTKTERAFSNLPKGWTRRRLRYDMYLNPKKSSVSMKPDELVSFIPMNAIREYGGLNLSDVRELIEVYDNYSYIADGDICIAKITPCFENGKGAIAKGLTNGVGFGTTEIHIIRPGPQADCHFLFYVSIADDFRKFGESEMYGAGGQKRIDESFIKDWMPPLPPMNIQRRIVRFLDGKTTQIDKLCGLITQSIDRLFEYRSALITTAVTGQLEELR